MIIGVRVFFVRVCICVSYNENGRCYRFDCLFLYICRDFVIDFCSNGVICLLNYYFYN